MVEPLAGVSVKQKDRGRHNTFSQLFNLVSSIGLADNFYTCFWKFIMIKAISTNTTNSIVGILKVVMFVFNAAFEKLSTWRCLLTLCVYWTFSWAPNVNNENNKWLPYWHANI